MVSAQRRANIGLLYALCFLGRSSHGVLVFDNCHFICSQAITQDDRYISYDARYRHGFQNNGLQDVEMPLKSTSEHNSLGISTISDDKTTSHCMQSMDLFVNSIYTYIEF